MHAIFNFRETIAIIAIPILLLPLPLTCETNAAVGAYAILVIVGYWVTEALPLPTTALLPVIVMPLLGVAPAKSICKIYMKQYNFLVFGCLLMAIAMEKWNLHRRIAFRILLTVGFTPKSLLMFFMIMTTTISVFVTNTATTALIIPIVHGVLTILDEDMSRRYNIEVDNKGKIIEDDTVEESNRRTVSDEAKTHAKNLAQYNKALRLSVPLAACFGGMVTLAGTPPNGELHDFVTKHYGVSQLTYSNWLIACLPHCTLLFFFAWIWIIVLFLGFRGLFWSTYSREQKEDIRHSIKDAFLSQRPISFAELAVIGHAVLLMLMWASREPKIAASWSSWYGKKYWFITDAASAILIGIFLFAFPSRFPNAICCRDPSDQTGPVSYPGLLDWPLVHARMPWGMLLMVGSGSAFTLSMQMSGLAAKIGNWMYDYHDQTPEFLVFITCFVSTILSQVTSNADTTIMMLPYLQKLTNKVNMNPLRLMVPATLCSSYGFFLPVSTPPNAIIFAFGRVQVVDMMICGIGMAIICFFVTLIGANTWHFSIFEMGDIDWMNTTATKVP